MRIPIADKTFFGNTVKCIEITLTDDLSAAAVVDVSLLDVDDVQIVKLTFNLKDIAPTTGSSGDTSYSDHWKEEVLISGDTYDFRYPAKLRAFVIAQLDVTPL